MTKIKMIMFGLLVAISMSACGGVGDIKPVDGDNRTIEQMAQEIEHNVTTQAQCGVFNCVWTK